MSELNIVLWLDQTNVYAGLKQVVPWKSKKTTVWDSAISKIRKIKHQVTRKLLWFLQVFLSFCLWFFSIFPRKWHD